MSTLIINIAAAEWQAYLKDLQEKIDLYKDVKLTRKKAKDLKYWQEKLLAAKAFSAEYQGSVENFEVRWGTNRVITRLKNQAARLTNKKKA